MIEAALTLKDGESRAVRMPAGSAFQELLHYLRVPSAAAGKMLSVELSTGGGTEIAAGDIASVEVAPPHVLLRDFLTDAERVRVLDFALTHVGAFQNSGVHEAPTSAFAPPRYRIRSSRVLDGPANGVMAAMMMPKLQDLMPALWPRLGIDPLPLNAMECQITAHGEGDFFAVHTDDGTPEIAHRRISYVYYFHREPKQFSGGHLSLYHTLYQGGYGRCGKIAADIDPPENGLMIFPTFIFHEVTPIRCASAALTDQRLTLNGWLF